MKRRRRWTLLFHVRRTMLFFALWVIKVQQHKQVINKSAHIVLGVNLRGEKEVLGLWLAENEGAKHRLTVLT